MKDHISKLCSETINNRLKGCMIAPEGKYNVSIAQAERIIAERKQALVLAYKMWRMK